MQLNGWQRLWIVSSIIWMIAVGMLTWTTWPATYLSVDPTAGIPVGADVTYLMEGVLSANEKVTKSEFARRVKAKYPAYLDLTDEALVDLTLREYPHYRQFISDHDGSDQTTPSAADVNVANRRTAVVWAAALGLIPPITVYVLGLAVAWIYRGFKVS